MAHGQALEQEYSLALDFSNSKIDYSMSGNLT